MSRLVQPHLNLGQPVDRGHPLARGLVAWWKVMPFGPYMGGVRLLDLSGRYHGTLTNGPVWSGALGRRGGFGSLKFDGTDDCVDTGSPYIVDAQLDISVSVWVYMTGNGSFPGILVKTSAFNEVTPKYACYCPSAARTPKFVVGGTAGTSATALVLNTWYHLVFTSNATEKAIYINTVKESFAASSAPTTSADNWQIGRWMGTSGMWPGYLDDLAIWNRSISASEVAVLYQRPNSMLNLIRPVWVNSVAAPGGGNRRRRFLIGAA